MTPGSAVRLESVARHVAYKGVSRPSLVPDQKCLRNCTKVRVTCTMKTKRCMETTEDMRGFCADLENFVRGGQTLTTFFFFFFFFSFFLCFGH